MTVTNATQRSLHTVSEDLESQITTLNPSDEFAGSQQTSPPPCQEQQQQQQQRGRPGAPPPPPPPSPSHRKGDTGRGSPGNGQSASAPARARRVMRNVILNFTPSWFSVNMGTGIVSILLYTLPYQFNGLERIADAIFVLNIVLFLIFLTFSLARYIVWPNLFMIMLFHPSQSLFLGTFPMGLVTIVNMCALSVAPTWGHNFVLFTWALWWIDVVLALFICIGVPFLQFTRHRQKLDGITAIWLLPVVSTIVAGSSGGVVAEILSPSQARLTLTVSWIMLGTGLPMALFLMALYYLRLAVYKLPPSALIVSGFLPLGPCGQGAYGLLKLSLVLWKLSKETGQALGGEGAAASVAEVQVMATSIYAVSIVAALLLWGLGLVWLVLAVSLFIDLWWVSELQFNLGWWGLTFPLGVFASAALQFGLELDSDAFRILGTILALTVVILWLAVSTKTLWKVCRGELFHSPCLAEFAGALNDKLPEARVYPYQPRSASQRRISLNLAGRSRSRSRSRTQSRPRTEARRRASSPPL